MDADQALFVWAAGFHNVWGEHRVDAANDVIEAERPMLTPSP
jgi:hypothetical protein